MFGWFIVRCWVNLVFFTSLFLCRAGRVIKGVNVVARLVLRARKCRLLMHFPLDPERKQKTTNGI